MGQIGLFFCRLSISIFYPGGADPSQDPHKRKTLVVGTVWSYEIETRNWFNESELLTPRTNFGLVVAHGRMYAIGGQDKNGVYSIFKFLKIQISAFFFN